MSFKEKKRIYILIGKKLQLFLAGSREIVVFFFFELKEISRVAHLLTFISALRPLRFGVFRARRWTGGPSTNLFARGIKHAASWMF